MIMKKLRDIFTDILRPFLIRYKAVLNRFVVFALSEIEMNFISLVRSTIK